MIVVRHRVAQHRHALIVVRHRRLKTALIVLRHRVSLLSHDFYASDKAPGADEPYKYKRERRETERRERERERETHAGEHAGDR